MTQGFDAGDFIAAQNRVWDNVLGELREGRKRSHWIWFVFPQLAALGQSSLSQRYGLRDLAEARSYLANETLRAHLVEAAGILMDHEDKSAEEILGPLDALKLRSSLTLFAAVPGAPDIFGRALAQFFQGTRCPKTLDLIG